MWYVKDVRIRVALASHLDGLSDISNVYEVRLSQIMIELESETDNAWGSRSGSWEFMS